MVDDRVPGYGGVVRGEAAQGPIDINTAEVNVLAAVPGMGAGRAESIVRHRLEHGPFAQVDELEALDGFGPETVDDLRPYLVAGPMGRA